MQRLSANLLKLRTFCKPSCSRPSFSPSYFQSIRTQISRDRPLSFSSSAHQTANRRTYATYRRFGNQHHSSFSSHEGFVSNLGALVGMLMYNRRVQVAALVLGGGTFIFYLSNVEPAPVSGRRRFIVTTPKLEQMLGDSQYHSLLAEYRGRVYPDNHPDVIRVKRVMKRLIAVSGMEDVDWQVHVIVDPSVGPNAMVLPGGKVFVFASMLNLVSNDDQLATVLSHETAHQLARHTGEKLSKQPFYSVIALTAWLITGSSTIAQLLIQFALNLPASRQMESEADYIGLLMMSQACYDPRQAIPFWQKMEKLGLARPMEFMSDHPSDQTRIAQITQWMPKALEIRENSKCRNTQSYMNELRDSLSFFQGIRDSDSIF
ncbi:peptidase family M48-domain-containing protein [Myxozyma melibiosi]|uniref:Peptidase family M48-domain-containing protein n=1 Tax=Myxozyma melibiosi TaxID=54550 RepID=A0ABR1EYI0_9ASCO